MKLEQIERVIAVEGEQNINLVYIGVDIFPGIEKDFKEKYKDTLVHEGSLRAPLLLPAFMFKDVLCISSYAIPNNSIMFCNVDKEELQLQQELIGWPVG